MTRNIPIRYLNEDSAFDAEVFHLFLNSERMKKLNDIDAHIDDCYTVILKAGCDLAEPRIESSLYPQVGEGLLLRPVVF